jgi:cyclophilin family peptidyl-prolyl cis-trans isomerase
MRNWFRRPHGRQPLRTRCPRPSVESLEDRCLLAAPVIDPIANLAIPAGKTYVLPVTASDADGDPLSCTVNSSDPSKVSVQLHKDNPYLLVSVAGFGDMVFQLFQDITPNTVQTIESLVQSDFYNDLTFHRIVKNFVIQGGDPAGDGSGGPGFTIDDELTPSLLYSGNGQLGMARSTQHDTGGSQFFVTVGPQRNLDLSYTIFGQMVRGFDVLAAINSVPTNPQTDKPLNPVVITRASIIQDTTDAVLLLTAAPGTPVANISVTATDGKGGINTRVFQVQGVNDSANNEPAILGPVPDQITPVNTPLHFTIVGQDLEGDPLTFGAIENDNATNAQVTVTPNGNTATVTVTPNPGYSGPLSILVGVSSTPSGGQQSTFDTQAIEVGVGDQPLAGQAKVIPGTEKASTGAVTVAGFIDADPNALATDFTAAINWGDGQNSPGVVSKSGGGFVVTGANVYREGGTFPVKVTITDSGGSRVVVTSTAVISDLPLTAGGGGLSINATQGTALANAILANFQDADNTATAADIAPIIYWGDGTISLGAIAPRPGGGFNVAGTHIYALDGRYTVTIIAQDGGSVAGTTDTVHVARVGAPPARLGQVANILTHSAEALSNFVRDAYNRYLNRPNPAAAEVNAWVAIMQGGFTDEQVEASFIGSPEYIANHGGAGAGWVQGMYHDLLNRTPSDAEVNAWVNLLNTGTQPFAIAFGFAASAEREGIRVASDYTNYLGRTASQAEINAWVDLFVHHGAQNEDVVAGFVGSPEYFLTHGDNSADWLTAAYLSILHRAPDDAGYSAALAFLQAS